MRQAFIMDPLDQVKPWKDTTYFLMLAATERGHQTCYLDQRSLSLQHNHLCGEVTWLNVNKDHQRPFDVIQTEHVEMSTMDAVWLRTDPPFDRRFFYTTLLLDFLPAKTRVLNQPQGVRNWNEKLSALLYPQLTPATLVTNSSKQIIEFSRQQGRVTIKPIDGYGGKGIFFYDQSSDDPTALNEATHQGQHWVIAQQYLSAAAQGDKRILLLEGEPLGAILRLHAEGVELNNLDAGGTAYKAELTGRDNEICQALKPGLLEQGGYFVGIDIIGDMLVEVNITSPTGLQELSQFNDEPYHHRIMENLEQ